MQWRKTQVTDAVPKGGSSTFTDYECGKLRLESHPRHFEVFDGKVYLGKTNTLRQAQKLASEYADNKPLKRKQKWKLTVSRYWARKLGLVKPKRRKRRKVKWKIRLKG